MLILHALICVCGYNMTFDFLFGVCARLENLWLSEFLSIDCDIPYGDWRMTYFFILEETNNWSNQWEVYKFNYSVSAYQLI